MITDSLQYLIESFINFVSFIPTCHFWIYLLISFSFFGVILAVRKLVY